MCGGGPCCGHRPLRPAGWPRGAKALRGFAPGDCLSLLSSAASLAEGLEGRCCKQERTKHCFAKSAVSQAANSRQESLPERKDKEEAACSVRLRPGRLYGSACRAARASPCSLPPAAFCPCGLQAAAASPVCPLTKGTSPQAVASPGLDPQRAGRAPFGCSFRASHRLS